MEFVTLYIDALFFINLGIDILLLWLVSFSSGKKVRFLRLLAGSFIGSLYCCLSWIAPRIVPKNLLLQAAVGAVCIYVTFRVRSRREFLRLSVLYYLLSFMLAGGIRFSFSFQRGFFVRYTLISVIFGAAILVFFSEFYLWQMKKKLVCHEQTFCITYNRKQLFLTAMSDTGNMLTEPLEHRSVMVVKSEKLKELVSFSSPDTVKNLRLIPCNTVTDGDAVLYGFKPDRVTCGDREVRVVVAASDALNHQPYDAVFNPVILLS